MKLRNNFTIQTRLLFENIGCYECGRRDQRELNHIRGRISVSPFNASVLCPEHHSHVGHSQEEEQKYIKITKEVLSFTDYEPTKEDKEFLEKYDFTNTKNA